MVAAGDIDRRVLPIHVADELGESLGSQPVFGAESAIRADSLQRAGALGLLHRLLAMGVDAEGLHHCEDKTRGNGR